MVEKKDSHNIKKIVKSFYKIFVKAYAPFLVPILVIALFVSPYIYQHRFDKEAQFYHDQIDSIGKDHGSFIALATARSHIPSALYYNSLTMEDSNVPISAKKNAELSSLLTKLDILKLTLATHPDKINDNWEILLLNEIINLSDSNKKLQVTYEIDAKYADKSTRPKILGFDLFYFASLMPPKIDKFIVRIVGGNKKIYDCSIEAVGSTNDFSPLYLIHVMIPAEDLSQDKINFKVYLPVLRQEFPFSVHDIPINRYVRGIRKLVAAFSFSDKVFINNYIVDMKDIEAKDFSEEYGNYLYNRKNTSGDDQNGYKTYAFEIQNPNSPIAIAYLKFNKNKIRLSDIPVR